MRGRKGIAINFMKNQKSSEKSLDFLFVYLHSREKYGKIKVSFLSLIYLYGKMRKSIYSAGGTKAKSIF